MHFKRAQAATEYLIAILAVLIISIILVTLLGYFPIIGDDAKISQSESYWKSARPFGILWHSRSGSNLTLMLQNNMPAYYSVSSIAISEPGGDNNVAGNRVYDSAGGNNAVLSGTIPTWTREGRVKGAYIFNSSSAMMRFTPPVGNFLANTSFSYGAWFESPTGKYAIGNGKSYNAQGWSISTSNGFSCYVYSSSLNLMPYYPTDTYGWHHAMCVLNGTHISLYVDGAFRDSQVITISGGVSNGDEFCVGKACAATPVPGGTIDEVAIYAKALSAEEISSMYSSNSYPNEKLLSHWRFDGDVAQGISSSFSQGDKMALTLENLNSCASGSHYEYAVEITYGSEGLTGLKQKGEKLLIGKCS